MGAADRRGVQAALSVFGFNLPTIAARAVGAGGAAPVFSGFVAPETSERNAGAPSSEEVATAWAERAALLEYDGGWPRPVAEAIATRLQAMEASAADPAAWAALDTELARMEETRSRARVASRADEPTGRDLTRKGQTHD